MYDFSFDRSYSTALTCEQALRGLLRIARRHVFPAEPPRRAHEAVGRGESARRLSHCQSEDSALFVLRERKIPSLTRMLISQVAKMYLYLNDPSHGLSQLNRHVFLFRQLSESWSIGEETFEFWSWLSKQ